MLKEDGIYIPGVDSPDDLQHGIKWSEEAKARVRAARKAGKTVEEMFGKEYKKLSKKTNRFANKVANKTIYKGKINKLQKTKRIVDRRMNTVIRSNKKISRSATNDYDRRVATSQISMAKNKKKLYRKLVKKNKHHSTDQIIKDGSKYLVKKANNDTKKAAKKLDKAITKKLNKRAYEKDKAVTTKAERKKLQKGLKRANDLANQTGKQVSKKVQNNVNKKLGNNLEKAVKHPIKYYQDTNKAKQAGQVVGEEVRNATLRTGQKKAYDSINNKKTYKNTGDFIKKQKNKLVDKAITKAAEAKVDRNNATNGGSVRSKSTSTRVTKNGYKYIEEDYGKNGFGTKSVTTMNSIDPKQHRKESRKEMAAQRKADKAAKRQQKLMRKLQVDEEKKKMKKKLGIKHSSNDMIYIPGSVGTTDAVLQHYGVLGMKWKTRRIQRLGGKINKFDGDVSTPKGLKSYKKIHNEALKIQKKAMVKATNEGNAIAKNHFNKPSVKNKAKREKLLTNYNNSMAVHDTLSPITKVYGSGTNVRTTRRTGKLKGKELVIGNITYNRNKDNIKINEIYDRHEGAHSLKSKKNK